MMMASDSADRDEPVEVEYESTSDKGAQAHIHHAHISFWSRFMVQAGALIIAFIIAVTSSASVSWLMTHPVRLEMHEMSAQMSEQMSVEPPAMSDARNQIEQLAAALNALQHQMSGEDQARAGDPDTQLMREELEVFRQAQGELDARLQAFREALLGQSGVLEGLGKEVTALQARLGSLDKASPGAAFAEAAVPAGRVPDIVSPVLLDKRGLAAFEVLRETARAGQVFSEQIAVMKSLFPDDANVQALVGLSGEATPGRADLVAQFAQLQEAWVRRAEEQRRANWSWYTKMTGGLIKWRSPPPPGGDEEILQSASRHLQNNDLDAARLTLSRLSPEAQIVLLAWSEQVDRRLEIDRHIRALIRVLGLQEP